VIYTARLTEAVYVLHVFGKKCRALLGGISRSPVNDLGN
jgi:phage-related protein